MKKLVILAMGFLLPFGNAAESKPHDLLPSVDEVRIIGEPKFVHDKIIFWVENPNKGNSYYRSFRMQIQLHCEQRELEGLAYIFYSKSNFAGSFEYLRGGREKDRYRLPKDSDWYQLMATVCAR